MAPHRPAFTLIETLIAGVILGIFAAAIAGGIARSSDAARRATDQRLAAQWLDEVFTRIDIIGPANLELEGPLGGQLDERFEWSATIEQPDAPLDIYTVSVTLSYSDSADRPHTVTGHTQFYDPPGFRDSTLTWDGPWE